MLWRLKHLHSRSHWCKELPPALLANIRSGSACSLAMYLGPSACFLSQIVFFAISKLLLLPLLPALLHSWPSPTFSVPDLLSLPAVLACWPRQLTLIVAPASALHCQDLYCHLHMLTRLHWVVLGCEFPGC